MALEAEFSYCWMIYQFYKQMQAIQIGMIFQFIDEAARDKSYNADGSLTEFGQKVREKMAPIIAETEKIGTNTSKYTDWLIL